MTFIEGFVLGLIQGLTEFLPVSSSGHLTLVSALFGIKEGNLFYSVMLHFSTLLAVFIYFRNDLINLIKAFFRLISKVFKRNKNKTDGYEKLVLLIIIGTIPTGIIGIAFSDFFESLYTNVYSVGYALIVTGIILLLSEIKVQKKYSITTLPMYKAGIIGIFQGFAIIPGISRSGSTIVGALLMGLNKEEAARFSFLLSMPAITGAALLEVLKINTAHITFEWSLVIGMIVAFVAGMISIGLLLSLVKKDKLYYFAIYVFALAGFIFIYF
ncbi:MAG: undecaprenyl-diphosphatase UppP [Tissierellales bacterium]|nr:undecaprenyl-diphosphatase UppP [Tissierellales bacterium]MBN2828310.1 undecaprenyl-diphosphatase UppP [Tissierellales bacterium]